jgi:hypothetical protein
MRGRHGPMLTAVALAAVAVAGCGGGSARPNDDRPPSPITITAAVGAQRVSVSPGAFGAGPVRLVVVNQTSASQQVTLESDLAPGEGPGIRRQTAPINPQDTATLAADVRPGRYTLRVRGGDIRRATLRVGAARPSSQNALLLP